MKKNWFYLLTGIIISLAMITGCNNDEPDPAPPASDNVDDENLDNVEENVEDNVPGVDENDTMNKDDENDGQEDPEDIVEDAEDIGDDNQTDQ